MSETPRLATLWLDGCSGCHMSLLDLDEGLLEVLSHAELVYGPLVDTKVFPEGVDVTLVEGAVATDEDRERIRTVRARTRYLVSVGDCAVTGNVPALRNTWGVQSVLTKAYVEHADAPALPSQRLPVLLDRVVPVHREVRVDLTLPGCPPPPDAIGAALDALLAGHLPEPFDNRRFGA